MIEVLTKIPKYSYSNAFPILDVSFTSEILKLELINNSTNVVVITEHYDRPPNGILHIFLSDIFRLDLITSIPDFSQMITSHPDVLKEYRVILSAEDSTTVTIPPFKILAGFGYKQQIVDTQLFIQTNVLTLRPWRSLIYDFEPICLSFFPSAAARVFIDIFFVDGTTTTLDYAPLTAQVVQSVNVSYGNIQRLVSKEVVSYKVYAMTSGKLVTNKIELVILPTNHLRESYTYSNRLGGWDSISFTGEEVEINSINPFTANLRDTTIQYDTDLSRAKQKNTGFIRSKEHHLQVIDFFRSPNKYVLQDGVLLPIVIRQFEPEYNKGQMNSFTFEYTYANTKDSYMPIDFTKPFISIS